MKTYTQEEFNSFEIVYGRRQCPSGDYSQIKKIGGGCSFGKGCSFGERCSYCLFEFGRIITVNYFYEYSVTIYLSPDKREYFLSIGCENFSSLEDAKKDSRYSKPHAKILEQIINLALDNKEGEK